MHSFLGLNVSKRRKFGQRYRTSRSNFERKEDREGGGRSGVVVHSLLKCHSSSPLWSSASFDPSHCPPPVRRHLLRRDSSHCRYAATVTSVGFEITLDDFSHRIIRVRNGTRELESYLTKKSNIIAVRILNRCWFSK